MLTRKKISVVPIAYRDEGNIPELYKRAKAVLRKITPNYEIVYVNDNSPDNSEGVLKKLAAKDKKLVVINHARNFGAQNAFTTGMRYATGDAVVIMDGDLQDPPELIEKFVEKWLQGNKVVYGVRRKREASMGRIWEILYHAFYVVFNKTGSIRFPLDVGDFSLMDREVVNHINALPEKDRFIRGLRAWVGFSQTGVDYKRPERYWGTSTNNFWKNIAWARKAIFSFSYAPLEVIFYLAIVSVGISFLAILVYLGLYFYSPGAPKGFLTILISVLFIGSVQLVTLSVICEYLRRMFEEVKNRPAGIVREVVNGSREGLGRLRKEGYLR
ncbi:MAG: glycosyltransferase family 2 protein [bacterium]|nr:glycosyltransferase family 2 protein [bacterium]